MSDPSFQEELLEFLQNDVSKRHPDERLDSHLLKTLSLSEIGELYHQYFDDKSSGGVEKRLFEFLSAKSGNALFPKIYRGLPRLYLRDFPAQSKIKAPFTHWPTLKRLVSERDDFKFYERMPLGKGDRVALFSWVIGDGLGDYIAALEVIHLLREKFPDLELSLVALIPSTTSALPIPENCSTHLIRYASECPVSSIEGQALSDLRSADVILQIPTYYPHTEQLKAVLKGIESDKPFPSFESIGEYGYLESSWFHPQTGNRSMGLHFLEKGILVRKSHLASFSEVENKQLLEWLFKTNSPGPLEIEEYFKDHRFFLAYLSTPVGGAVYLHALLKSLERDNKTIDLCVPSLDWLIEYLQRQNEHGRPLLEGEHSVQRIEIYYDRQVHTKTLKSQGKLLRIFCPGPISTEDFRRLISLSGEFVAVRGDQSFSEAVSANKAFFYDGREHARYFLKDLAAIAENRIASHRNSLICFRGMAKAFLHNLPLEKGEWVDETYFQEREEWSQIALNMGLALQDPDAIAGMKKLSRIIAEEHSCNDFLCHLIQRAVWHQKENAKG